MSKQGIEKRLGFAAQGVKSEFGSNDPYMQERTVKTRKGKTTDLVAEIGQNGGGGDYIATLMLVHSNGEPQVLQSKYGYKTPESATRAAIRLFDAHVSRGGYARSGAKTSFSNRATTNAFLSKIDAATRNKILTSIAKHYGISASQAMAEVTDADAESLLDYMTEPERSATSVLLKRHGFSRAGAKSAMAKPLRKAEPYEALYYKWFNGIQVSIMDMTKIKNDINAIIASGANPDVEMPKLVKKYGSSGFSRLGAKAKMGRPKTVTVITMMSGTGGSGGLFKVVGYDENGREFEYGMFAMRSMAEQKAKDVARWTDSKYISSRPSTKAKMASGWSGKTAKLNRYGDFAVVAAGEDGYAKGFANRTQAQAFSDKHNLGGVKFPSSGGRSFYVYVEAPKDSESTTASRPGVKAKA